MTTSDRLRSYTDPETVDDLARLQACDHDERMTVLACLPPNGIAATDSSIAATTGLPVDRIRARLSELAEIGVVAGHGAWWHRKTGER